MSYKAISPIPIVEGGTGAQTLTSNGVLVGAGTSAITALTPGTDGQVIIGNTGTGIPAWASLTAGANITLTPGANSLTIAAAGGGSSGALFNAYVSADQNGVTGDGTAYTVLFDTVLSNVGATYVAGTGTFTAPATAQYILSGGVMITNASGGIGSPTDYYLHVVTTGFTYIGNNPGNGVGSSSPDNTYTMNFSIITTMTMGDTATVVVAGNGGGAGVVNVNAAGSYWGAYKLN